MPVSTIISALSASMSPATPNAIPVRASKRSAAQTRWPGVYAMWRTRPQRGGPSAGTRAASIPAALLHALPFYPLSPSPFGDSLAILTYFVAVSVDLYKMWLCYIACPCCAFLDIMPRQLPSFSHLTNGLLLLLLL